MKNLFITVILSLFMLVTTTHAQENKAANICDKEIKKKHPQLKRVGKYCTEAGHYYKKKRKYSKALKYYKNALTFVEKVLGKENINTAHGYNNIGDLYKKMGEYPKALEYYKESLIIKEKVLGKEHADNAIYYNNIGLFYQEMGSYPKALEYFQKALNIKEKVFGKEHTSTANSYNNIGLLYSAMGEYPKAMEYVQRALNIREKMLGKEHTSTATSYNNIGYFYQEMGEYPKALEYYKKALTIRKKLLGKEHISTAGSYNIIGYFYNERGEYPKALEYFQKALTIREKVLGKEHTSTATSYNNIGSVYRTMGDHPKGLEYYKKALIIREKVLGKEHADTANSYNNIGQFYQSMGDYPKALEYLQRALNIREKVLGKEHTSTANTYNLIGSLYKEMGDYLKTLEYYKKALIIREKVLGKEHTSTAQSYNDIGHFYQSIGEYPKGLEYTQKALTINEKVLGKEHANTAGIHNNMGLLYSAMGEYTNALDHYKKFMTINEKVFGKEHISTAASYHNIGLLYENMEEYPKALKYAQKSLKIFERAFGKEHTSTATNYHSIGHCYQAMGEYTKALDYYKKSLAIREKVLGKEHADTASSYHKVGSLYEEMEDYAKGYLYAKLAFNIFRKNRDKIFTILDSQQKEKYLKSTSRYVALLLNTSIKYFSQLNKNKKATKAQQILQSGTNAWLNYKGSIFDSENAISMLYSSTKNKKLKTKIDALVTSKRYLAKLYQSLPEPKERNTWKSRIKKTEKKIATLTNDITKKSAIIRDQQDLKSLTYKDITSHLKEDELYIDYAKAGDYYYLFTLDHEENIEFVQIDKNSTKKIDNLVKTFREDITTILKDGSLTDEQLQHLTQSSKEKLSELYALIIENPLVDTIKHKTSLIISPDGALRLLPFEALYNKNSNKYFIEEKEIRYIPSGKELVRLYKYAKDKKSKDKKSAVIFANPNFDTKIASASKEQIAITPNTNRSGIIKSLFKMRFDPLPGTKAEAKAIKSTLGKNVKEYNRNKATESTLMKVKEPNILHIATHGFFINDNTIPNPMLKSGIALAGANTSAIKGKSEGIVTALKLSGLDLKGTDLVVLSACQTGVVDINSTDSVSGLSKAFIQAGAKDIVMSLWSVNDEATKDLMSSFYEEMKENKNYAKALKAAKLKMIADGRHPFYWAAFVVSGL